MTRPPAVLGIGTATFLSHYGIDAGAAPGEALLAAAIAAGIRYIDTAADYGDSERAVGRTRAAGVHVCTKIKATDSEAALRASVERLGGPPDTILMHSAGREQLTSAPAIASLHLARRTGLTAQIGASTYGAGDAEFALSLPWVEVVQVEYSILNQSVIRHIAARQQTVVARSVLCKGLLTSRRAAAPRLLAQVRDAIDAIEDCAREWGRTVEDLAIRFALDTPGIDVVVVGVSNETELGVALSAANAAPLTAGQWTRLAGCDRSATDAAHPERWGRAS